MLNRMREHVSPALIIAVIALVTAMGGAAYAVTKAPKNSVTTKSIKKNAVTGAKVKNDSLTGNDINESTLSLPSTAVPRTTFGAETNDSGGIVNATLPGTTASKASNTFTIHFPRSVVNCVAAGSGLFDGSTSVVRSGTGNPNDVIASNASGTSVSVIVTCPS